MTSESDNAGGDDPDPTGKTRRTVDKTEQKKRAHSTKELKKKRHRKGSKDNDSPSSSDDGKNPGEVRENSRKSTSGRKRKLSPRQVSSRMTKEDEEILNKEAELTRSFCKTKCSSVVEDSVELVQQLEAEYNTASQCLNKPNVLVTGITGAGKSSLINSMFGQEVAATGAGVPITQHFSKYDSDSMRTVIYDSKGLEHGEYKDFIESTEAFFEERMGGSDDIHVVWYIVNTAHARFEPFEQELCTRLFNRVPILFLLNKSDISTQEDRKKLRKIIEDMALPNCCGIVEVIASSVPKLKSCDTCPRCNSDDVVERRKIAKMTCNACGYTESLLLDNGLEKVVKASLEVLPQVLRNNFIAAQTVSFSLKEEAARSAINLFWTEFSGALSYKDLVGTIARMMAQLSLVWEFRGHSNQIGFFLAGELATGLDWKNKMSVLGQKKKFVPSQADRLHVTSLGILWSLCLRELSLQLLTTWASEKETCPVLVTSCSSSTCATLFGKAFSAVNETNLKSIEIELLSSSVDQLLTSNKLSHLTRKETIEVF